MVTTQKTKSRSHALGWAAALALTWGCSMGGDGDIPEHIAGILAQHCAGCHGAIPTNMAPMPIITCDDIVAESPSGGSVLAVTRTRITIEDESALMPPGVRLPDEPLAAMVAWLDDGAPPCQ